MKIAPPTVYYAEQPHSSLGLIWAAATDKGLWSLSYGKARFRISSRVNESALIYTLIGAA
jgi:hypothetical protein